MNRSVGFIGGGRVTRILLQGLRNTDLNASGVFVTDISQDVLGKLKQQFPEIELSDPHTCAGQDIVFLSLHPPVVMEMLELIGNAVKPEAVVISLAPKITLAKLSQKLGHVRNITRMIPNATSIINEGYNPVKFSPDFDPGQKLMIMELMRSWGTTFEVAEEKLESYAIMSAMLPTYFWFQWRVLADIGGNIGLSEDESKESIFNTLVASLNLMYRSGLTESEVVDLIPVKPIGEYESQISDIYKTKLTGLFDKIRP